MIHRPINSGFFAKAVVILDPEDRETELWLKIHKKGSGLPIKAPVIDMIG